MARAARTRFPPDVGVVTRSPWGYAYARIGEARYELPDDVVSRIEAYDVDGVMKPFGFHLPQAVALEDA